MDDLRRNFETLAAAGIPKREARMFIPPYEWYNDSIAQWAREAGLELFNFTPGTRSNADYTTPELNNYRSSAEIYQSILDREKTDPNGLNGFFLLMHIGTGPGRKDKFYKRLGILIQELRVKGYTFEKME